LRLTLHSLLVLLAASTTACSQTKLPEGTVAERNLAYGEHERQKLDLFIPKGDGPFPLVLWVHGGGWEIGSKENNPFMPMLAKGNAVASTNYRYSKQAVFPAQIHDCKAAVRFLRANATKYKLNPDAFGVAGASAGGHLVALLGTAGNVKELEGDGGNAKVSSKVHCVVDVFGPTDLIKLAGATDAESPITKLLGGKVSEKQELATLANPITHINKDCPPFLILHGDMDKLVLLSQSELLLGALQKAKIPAELIVVKGAGHDGVKVMGGENAAKVAAFFDKHLMKK